MLKNWWDDPLVRMVAVWLECLVGLAVIGLALFVISLWIKPL